MCVFFIFLLSEIFGPTAKADYSSFPLLDTV